MWPWFSLFWVNLTNTRVMLFRKFVCGFQNNMTCFANHKICFQHSQCVVLKRLVGLYDVESNLQGYVNSRLACFYLTGQLESILQKFRLAGVVLVVLKPHVFNLTGQLASKPPEFSTLAATDQAASSNLLFISRKGFDTYMLLPICAQFRYANGDPHMRIF